MEVPHGGSRLGGGALNATSGLAMTRVATVPNPGTPRSWCRHRRRGGRRGDGVLRKPGGRRRWRGTRGTFARRWSSAPHHRAPASTWPALPREPRCKHPTAVWSTRSSKGCRWSDELVNGDDIEAAARLLKGVIRPTPTLLADSLSRRARAARCGSSTRSSNGRDRSSSAAPTRCSRPCPPGPTWWPHPRGTTRGGGPGRRASRPAGDHLHARRRCRCRSRPVEGVAEHAVAVKPQLAFFEQVGQHGLAAAERVSDSRARARAARDRRRQARRHRLDGRGLRDRLSRAAPADARRSPMRSRSTRTSAPTRCSRSPTPAGRRAA